MQSTFTFSSTPRTGRLRELFSSVASPGSGATPPSTDAGPFTCGALNVNSSNCGLPVR